MALFTLSRLWRKRETPAPTADTTLQESALELKLKTLEAQLVEHRGHAAEWHKERMALLSQIDQLTLPDSFNTVYAGTPMDGRDGAILNRAYALYRAADKQLSLVSQHNTWAVTSNGVECLTELFFISKFELLKDDWPLRVSLNPKVNMHDFLVCFYDGRHYHHPRINSYQSARSTVLKATLERSPITYSRRVATYATSVGESRPGYVYLFKCDDLYKIGFSINPASRLREVRRDQADIIGDRLNAGADLLCLHTIHVDHMRNAERRLHTHFAHRHYKREWFKLTQADVD